MPYATHQDLERRVGEKRLRDTADHDRDGVADSDVLDAALKDADSLINGYVKVRYSLPLATVPDLLVTWSVSIALYQLHQNGAPKNIEADYKDAISALKDVSAGRLALPIEAGETALTQAGGTTIAAHPPQVFTSEKLRGW